jgi:3-hydroxyacyl-CoA dehydrogenase
MLSGKHVTGDKAVAMGLIDRIGNEPLAEAVRFVGEVGRAPRPTSKLPLPADLQQAVSNARTSLKARTLNLAPRAIIDAVAAAETGRGGFALERTLFGRMKDSEPSRALRHVFFGQRAAATIPSMPADLKPESIRSAAVVGDARLGS